MGISISDITTKLIGDKKRWKQYKARAAALPTSHRTAIDGIERYLMYTGPNDGEQLMRMLDDLAARAAAARTAEPRQRRGRRTAHRRRVAPHAPADAAAQGRHLPDRDARLR
ncbi:DUF1048 domain-containing protein, partial [Bacillus sp. S34]|nr:DUF1048 domain-containing protein [Bacillus sp. S34]